MKLDRNINPNGKGKYALINLRTNQVQWGTEPNGQFFVIKYKDKFAEPALRAYAAACMAEAARLSNEGEYRDASALSEFASEILREANIAGTQLAKHLPD